MAIETLEGDFLIRSGNPGKADLIRIHMTRDSMVITATECPQRQVIVADLSEAKQLRDWIDRRLNEEI
jgi:hypothetical protein